MTGDLWVIDRLRCAVSGHEWSQVETDLLPQMIVGHRCDRCGAKSPNLRAWENHIGWEVEE